MSNLPSLDLRVGDTERARAEALLQDAYCAGRLDEVELDERLGMVMTAQRGKRREVNMASRANTAPTPESMSNRRYRV